MASRRGRPRSGPGFGVDSVLDELGRVAPCGFTAPEYGVLMETLDDVASLQALPARFAEARRERQAACRGDCHSTRVFEKFALLAG